MGCTFLNFTRSTYYCVGLMDELDVLVVGGYFGVGHRAGMMSHFLCAVSVPPSSGDKPELFYSFCKVCECIVPKLYVLTCTE